MFRRLRILCGGHIVEDIDLYGRLHEQFHMMKPTEKRINGGIQDFDAAVPANAEKVVCFTPMSGLLSREKYLPIRYCPLRLELELDTSANDAFVPAGTPPNANFELSDVQLKVNLVTLDHSLDN